MSLTDNYLYIRNSISENIRVIAVSKTKPKEDIFSLYSAGHRDFGESKVQELTAKKKNLPDDIRWHMIGHLQTNKVKYIAPFIDTIQSVDSLKLLSVINDEAKKNNRIIKCFIEMHIAAEKSKYGLTLDEVKEIILCPEYKAMQNIQIAGLMGMATFIDNTSVVRDEFRYMKQCFDLLKMQSFAGDDNFKEISMGMSDDYQIAIEEGATMIRLGTVLFGEKDVK